ncbi:unnamed protein product [Blepharisma stoltei]|uniref:Maturase K n=1 Tax=Blepharisma stoltei TaxID=1481888 RepID=A0AAU9J656_9CILI|nr:unnamed protein product [Blepharisma stoltei]
MHSDFKIFIDNLQINKHLIYYSTFALKLNSYRILSKLNSLNELLEAFYLLIISTYADFLKCYIFDRSLISIP